MEDYCQHLSTSTQDDPGYAYQKKKITKMKIQNLNLTSSICLHFHYFYAVILFSFFMFLSSEVSESKLSTQNGYPGGPFDINSVVTKNPVDETESAFNGLLYKELVAFNNLYLQIVNTTRKIASVSRGSQPDTVETRDVH